MPKRINIEQSGPDWHRWRAQGLGGSDAPAVLGTVKWATPETLLECKLGKRTVEENEKMARGKRLEPEARQRYIELSGNHVLPACLEHDTLPWLRASLDGISKCGKLVLEIKCPSRYAHQQALNGRYPDYYKPQLYQQLLVSGAERLDYFSYLPDDPTLPDPDDHWACVEVYPDPEYQEMLLGKLKAFQARVEEARREQAERERKLKGIKRRVRARRSSN